VRSGERSWVEDAVRLAVSRLVRYCAPRPRGLVVEAVNSARTQNGHIRNDMRDASRRISIAYINPICRRNCVVDDRACTRW
jgi:hypothetical protein